MKKIAILPTLLTLGNGICGFAAIAYASKIGSTEFSVRDDAFFFAVSGWLILIAMVFDMLDGTVARLSRTASNFGGELDSLCDAISFGVAPAFLLLKMGPGWSRPLLHQLLAGIAALYMVCTVLRLARFNVDNSPDPASHKRFKGLPSPGAAGCLASLAIFRGEFPAKLAFQYWSMDLDVAQSQVVHFVEAVSPLGALLVALLMVSLVPYPHITKQVLKGRRHVSHVIQLLLGLIIILLFREIAILVLFWGYSLALPVHYLVVRNFKGQAEPQVTQQGNS